MKQLMLCMTMPLQKQFHQYHQAKLFFLEGTAKKKETEKKENRREKWKEDHSGYIWQHLFIIC